MHLLKLFEEKPQEIRLDKLKFTPKNKRKNIKIRKRPPKWTEEEIAYLKERYSTATWEELEKKLNRRKGAIRMKASALDLKRRVRKPKQSRWDDKRKAYLQENYKKKSVQEIADELGFSYSTVANMASKMGITNPPWTEEDERYLRENYHKYRPAYMAKELGRTASAIYEKASKMGLTK